MTRMQMLNARKNRSEGLGVYHSRPQSPPFLLVAWTKETEGSGEKKSQRIGCLEHSM